jgi:hypothetical protein
MDMEVRGVIASCQHTLMNTVPGIMDWPNYAGNPTNFVFRTDRSYVEIDNDRAEGVAYMNSLVR